ncbi:hypothetical protein [Alloacidobacterium sp.]|uniref:hypothetical protein n=1 Tax=Alloacidobacterium sp. TaxID=2951999 RepID=UPI002D2F79D8|nr:hypothetical protein [Alloacidobacterium sp.]HYK35677.1 hypothetical protein [Alloacidobacterium sp.]
MKTTATVSQIQRGRGLYVGLSIFFIALVFTGFSRTYFLNEYFEKVALTQLLHVHGVVFSMWFALFAAQVALVAAGRTDLHRRLGVAGALLVCIMVPLGLTVAIHAEKSGQLGTPSSAIAFARLVIPFFDITVFGTLAIAGLLFRRRPQVHRRLMTLATFSILTPAIVRIPLNLIQRHGVYPPYLIAMLLMLLYIACDTVSHKELHPACRWGGLFFVLSVPFRFAISGTAAWLAFAQWLTR